MARLFALLLTVACAFCSVPATATPVLLIQRLTPSAMGIADTAVFELRITGLTDVLGAFSADISFDGGVLAFEPASDAAFQFGSRLGDPLTETISAAFVAGPGLLHLDQVSLLDATSLDALQRDATGTLLTDFVLAEVSFTGFAPGFSLLEFATGGVVLSDSFGTVLSAPLLGTSGVGVVPSPGTSLLLIPGLCLLAMSRSRRALRKE